MRTTNSLARIAALAAIILAGCSSPTAPTEEGESGTRYSLTDVARESRAGINLEMRYDAPNQTFTGTLTNTTNASVDQVRVEIHLSNGVELGPTARVTLAAGQVQPVTLDARGRSFASWSIHIEIGASS